MTSARQIVLIGLLGAGACTGEPDASLPGGDAGTLPGPGPLDGAPLPDAPPTCRYVDLLAGGSFDGAGSPWGERATNGLPIIRDAEDLPVPPTSMPRAAWLAGYANGLDRIWQDVDVPANTRAISMAASWCAFTLEDDDAVDDVLGFLIQEPGTTDTYEVAHSLANLDADPGEGACAWHSFRKDLRFPYAGQTVMLKIYGTCDGDGPTDFFLDDVSLSALVCD